MGGTLPPIGTSSTSSSVKDSSLASAAAAGSLAPVWSNQSSFSPKGSNPDCLTLSRCSTGQSVVVPSATHSGIDAILPETKTHPQTASGDWRMHMASVHGTLDDGGDTAMAKLEITQPFAPDGVGSLRDEAPTVETLRQQMQRERQAFINQSLAEES